MDKRIVHLHIPKTAGTALKEAFQIAFKGRMRSFPHWDERKFEDIDPSQYDFYSGHFGFKTACSLDGEIISVLRGPVDRFLSVYYFWRQLAESGAEVSRNTALASKYSLAEFVKIKDEPGLIEEFSNRMTWQVAYGASIPLRRELRDTGITENELFKLAARNLEMFSVLGIQEDIHSFSDALKEKFGINLSVPKLNVTKIRGDVHSVDSSVLREIQSWMPLDIELYNYAVKIRSQLP